MSESWHTGNQNQHNGTVNERVSRFFTFIQKIEGVNENVLHIKLVILSVSKNVHVHL